MDFAGRKVSPESKVVGDNVREVVCYNPFLGVAKDRIRIRIVDGDVMNDFGAVLFFAIDCFSPAVVSHCICDCHEDRVWVRILPCKDRDGIVKVPVPSLPLMRKVSTGSSMTARMRVCAKIHFRT